MKNRVRAAFALAYFLLVVTILTFLTLATVGVCRRQLFGSSSAIEHSRALNAAESGLNFATAELEASAAWSTGYNQKATLDGLGRYSLHFASPTAAGPFDSVNNLAGSNAVDSYRGPATVPPHSVLLVVKGTSGATTRTIEALLVPGANAIQTFGLCASGAIELKGKVTMDGVVSQSDLTPVLANMHSNSEVAGAQVTYQPNLPGDSLSVSGAVTSSSASPVGTSIQLAAPATVGSQQSQLPPKRLPSVNVDAVVDAHVGSPGPPIPGGPAPLILNGGDHYYPGDVSLNGDLQLRNGAKIYVAGDLQVNGSVTGSGGIVVKGTTRLHGDADITANSSDYVSVLSKGSVVLAGFEGETYMNALTAGDTASRERWQDLRFAVQGIRDYLQAHSALTPEQRSLALQSDDAQIDALSSIVSSPWAATLTDPVSGRVRHQNTVAGLRTAVGSGSASQQFLANRLQSLDDLFRVCWNRRDGSAGRYTATDLMDNYASWDPVQDGGLFDSIQSFGEVNTAARVKVMQSVELLIYQLDYNRLGSANFKGFVYTSGAFVAHNDVNLLGSIVVNGDPSVGSVTVGNITYQPGQLAVLNSCRVTYVDEMFRNGIQNLQGVGALDLKRWVNR